jgi:hypothetical protein
LGQKTSFQKAPTDWVTPRFDTKDKRLMAGENGNSYHLERFAKLKREAAVHWAVFADRERTPVYDDASDKNPPIKYANMGDMYRVNAEKGEFFEVFTFSGLDESKETRVGWIHKSNLVLWRRPLTERRTGIDIKAFIVNTQDFISAKKSSAEIVETKEIYRIYGSPQGVEPIAQGNLYNVLFVFKYDENRIEDEFE